MKFREKAKRLAENYFKVISWAALIGGVGVLSMMSYITADVTGRYLFNKPVPASFEIVQVGMVCAVFLGLAYSQARGGHIRIEFLMQRFGPRGKIVLELLALFIGLSLFALVTWQAVEGTLRAWREHLAMQGIWGIPEFPSRLAFAIGVFAFCIQYIIDIVRRITQMLQLR